MKSIIDLINLESRQFAQCPEMTVDPTKDYTATIKTEKGDIVMKLFADKAPMAVNSFIFLARSGWFDDSPFHRVIPDFVAQGGDPSGSGMGGPGYYFGNEVNDLKFDKPGMVGMANSGPDTNGSQFFIAFNQLPQLDGGYTIFAQVVEGLDVAGKLNERVPEEGKVSNKPDRIITVTIEEK
ncbi:peptidylprolyl isomerase [bacterium]|nr:peptidylprolyl isomerase [bacterium]